MRGFSLIELAIVALIIGLLTVGVLKGQSLVDAAKTQGTIKLSMDIIEAVNEFKEQHGVLPGDMQSPPFSDLQADCIAGGNSNGIIVNAESKCIPDLLRAAGIISNSTLVDGYYVIQHSSGTVKVISPSESRVAVQRGANPFRRSVTLIAELENVPCNIAKSIDQKIDDGKLSSGKIIATEDDCVAGNVVPFLAIAF